LRINTAKQRLFAGKPALGAVLGMGSPLAAEVLAAAGFDFLLVDAQHGAWDDYNAMLAFRAIAMGPTVPMARVQKNDFYTIGRLLDRGALGIVVPMVNSPEEARAAVQAMHYPPRGQRSSGATLASFYGLGYEAWIEDQLFLAVQIETAGALERADEIMAVDGVDGCWIGPGDLSRSLGLDPTTDAGREALEGATLRIRQACLNAGKVPGIWGGPDARRWLDLGFLFVTTADDVRLLGSAARAALERVRPPER
jgi:4-hydroxy-2-oxoheptanedioate aldolase